MFDKTIGELRALLALMVTAVAGCAGATHNGATAPDSQRWDQGGFPDGVVLRYRATEQSGDDIRNYVAHFARSDDLVIAGWERPSPNGYIARRALRLDHGNAIVDRTMVSPDYGQFTRRSAVTSIDRARTLLQASFGLAQLLGEPFPEHARLESTTTASDNVGPFSRCEVVYAYEQTAGGPELRIVFDVTWFRDRAVVGRGDVLRVIPRQGTIQWQWVDGTGLITSESLKSFEFMEAARWTKEDAGLRWGQLLWLEDGDRGVDMDQNQSPLEFRDAALVPVASAEKP